MAQVCKRKYVLDNGQAVGMDFNFANGNSHRVMWDALPEDVQNMAMAHGFNQTLGDSYSGSGGDATVAEGMFLARLEVLETEWKSSERGGGLADDDLAHALSELTGESLEVAQAAVAKGDKDWKDARRKRKDVGAIIAKRVADRKQAKADGAAESIDDLL